MDIFYNNYIIVDGVTIHYDEKTKKRIEESECVYQNAKDTLQNPNASIEEIVEVTLQLVLRF